MRRIIFLGFLAVGCATRAPVTSQVYDVLIRGGTVYDGHGGAPVVADVAVTGDRIAAVGRLAEARASVEIDARGLAVAPGFINMLSHSEESFIQDGRGLSALRQGVTLEVLGEGSMGPVDGEMKKRWKTQQDTVFYELTWSTLGEYLEGLERRGIAPNVASFVGAGTVRERVVGLAARPATPAELDEMRALVGKAMDEGALGVTTALIYPPDTFSTTEELIALARVAAERGGIFSAHIRSESNRIDAALDEMLRIAREAAIPVEIYHLKLAGRANWGRLDEVVKKIEDARAAGLQVTADMYTYTAGRTGLDASMPPWVQEGGYAAWAKRLRDPAVRAKVKAEMERADVPWENFFALAGPENMRFISFKNPELKRHLGRTLAEVAAERKSSPAETAMDLVIEDGTRVGVAYFLMSEDNLRRQVALPWVSFCSDEPAMAPVPPFTDNSVHPRAYGNFARLLGKYVRDEKALPLAEAVRKLTSFPAATLGIADRGALVPGYFADVVIFDAARVQDHATFDKPHQLATGVLHVLVNGVPVLRDSEPTAARPGRIIRPQRRPTPGASGKERQP